MDFYSAELFRAVSNWIGYDISPLAPVILGAVSALLPLAIFIVTMRRRMSELRSITNKIESAARHASDTTIRKFETLHDDLRATVSGQIVEVGARVGDVAGGIEALKTYLRSTTEVTATQADAEIRDEPQGNQLSKPRRLTLAENVRNTVMTKWLAGGYLSTSETDPNVFRFSGTSLAGEKIALTLHTPYRKALGHDGRLPFALDVWVNARKHLNFEWTTDGDYALRGFTRGEWIEDLANWNFPVGISDQTVLPSDVKAA
jgi:hypothetical protein